MRTFMALSATSCAALLWLASPAPAVTLSIDPSASSITGPGGSVGLSGTLVVNLGAEPPLVGNTTFDVIDLSANGDDGSSITLDPTLQSPAAGVLNPAGTFLIPNLFLRIDDGVSIFDLTVPDVTGQFGAFAGCPTLRCLQTTFQIDTQGPAGVLSVQLFAVPEPGSVALLAWGLAGLAAARRSRPPTSAQRGREGR